MGRMDNIGSIAQYKNSLCNVCFYSALLQTYADKKASGEPVDGKDVVYATMMLAQFKQFLLSDKAILGFDDGLSFMEDNKFWSFEIKDGKFSGDREQVLPIVTKWVDGFPENANNYQYEVAVLTLALAFPEEIRDEMAANGVKLAA